MFRGFIRTLFTTTRRGGFHRRYSSSTRGFNPVEFKYSSNSNSSSRLFQTTSLSLIAAAGLFSFIPNWEKKGSKEGVSWNINVNAAEIDFITEEPEVEPVPQKKLGIIERLFLKVLHESTPRVEEMDGPLLPPPLPGLPILTICVPIEFCLGYLPNELTGDDDLEHLELREEAIYALQQWAEEPSLELVFYSGLDNWEAMQFYQAVDPQCQLCTHKVFKDSLHTQGGIQFLDPARLNRPRDKLLILHPSPQMARVFPDNYLFVPNWDPKDENDDDFLDALRYFVMLLGDMVQMDPTMDFGKIARRIGEKDLHEVLEDVIEEIGTWRREVLLKVSKARQDRDAIKAADRPGPDDDDDDEYHEYVE